MIDIHSHILPGVDDGPNILKETISLAGTAIDQGIHTIIATPHRNGHYKNEREDIIGIVDYVNAKLHQQGIQLMILPGQEVQIYEDIANDLKRGLLLPLNETTPYVLIELPTNKFPQYTTQLVFDMQIAGYIPIIANPEKNRVIADNPNLLYDIVKNGALLQIEASSVIGSNGKRIEKVTQQLLRANLVHFIASNAHDNKRKGFNLQKAYNQLGEDYREMFLENSERLISGKTIIKDAPQRITNKGIWRFLK